MAHVLVIDDSRLSRELLRSALTRDGFGVEAARSAAEGVEAIRRKRPDAVLLDLDMPGRDGAACLKDIRADASLAGLPVVMVSAAPERDAILEVAHIGVQGFIIKNEHLVLEVLRRLRVLLPGRALGPGRPLGVVPAKADGPPSEAAVPPASVMPAPRAPATEAEDAESLKASLAQLDTDSMDIENAAEELRKLKPLMTRSDLLGRVLEGAELRAIKPAVQQVLSLTGSSGASIDSIAKAIKQDQALSIKVLKIANSPLYTRGERVETVQKAVARIGVDQIRATVLSLSVIDRFGAVGLAQRIKADWFWEHSIACGLIASRIARVRGLKPDAADALFTAGLLHDVGRVIYTERLGEEYAGVIATADALEMPLETVESRLLLINHADLTDRILREWNFSTELVNPIALHHLSVGNIRRTAPKMAETVATLALGNRLAHALLLGSSGNDVLYPVEEFVQFLGLSAEQMHDLCTSVPEQTLDLKLQMLAHADSSGAGPLDEARKALGVEVRPLLVSAQPEADAVGMLLGRLCPGSAMGGGAGAAAGPNIAIVRVNSAKERATMLTRLRQAETEAGAKDLPTLVVCSSAGCFYTEGMLGPERRAEQVVMPMRLSRLIRAINGLLRPPDATGD